MDEIDLDRLMAYVKKIDGPLKTKCWVFNGTLNDDGYATIKIGTRMKSAHRILFEHYNGPIIKPLELDHLCKKRSCVNPKHLEIVTHFVNVSRGKSCLLSEKEVIEIRTKYKTGKWTCFELAEEYFVSKSNISAIIRQETWKAIDA